MSTTEIRQPEPAGPGWRKWLLPAILALLIAAIVLGAFFATHPHVFGGGATNTPTPTSMPSPTATPHFPPTATPSKVHVRATATPKPAPTGTPQPGPTGTPRPGPTATPRPSPTPNVTPTPTLKTGLVSYTQSQQNAIQQGVSSNDPNYAYYQDPYKVVQNDLKLFGFNGATIVSPQPGPTPTPYTGDSGLPEVQITVQYQGKRYLIVLDQKSLGGAKAWLIVRIKPL